MGAWLKGAWARIGLWAKLGAIAFVSLLGYLAYTRYKRMGAEAEAARLQGEIAVRKAEAQVAFLEGQKVRNAARLAQIPAESAALDAKIKEERKRLLTAQAQVEGLTDEQLAARFREQGY